MTTDPSGPTDPAELTIPLVAGAHASCDPSEAQDVLRAIRRIIRAVDIHSKRVARQSGLTLPQLVVLLAIRDLGEVTTRTIAAHASLSQATVTTILDNLEPRGLVVRDRSLRDRRIVHPRLTESGRAVLSSAPPVMREAFTAAFAALTPETRQTIVTSFEMVATLMEAAGQDEVRD
ncbi:DNA-binding MarR family transcriptional regulator [Tepidamorphus gemmatus]|uniref:DNA-binding MarR family transcriptional regulator n=1 Tax=Tepidamorphus gemmatus TaxID=747076 RepID=A0A4R3M9Y7_9HYPH|nr:MarR family transcriptional regulator [Tepidamorphus gemmatus]TCT10026.1 DNA-binding MarR family transcriptional regulator [Tepidamorphus gemmatus]